jgi:hypothetical protein
MSQVQIMEKAQQDKGGNAELYMGQENLMQFNEITDRRPSIIRRALVLRKANHSGILHSLQTKCWWMPIVHISHGELGTYVIYVKQQTASGFVH